MSTAGGSSLRTLAVLALAACSALVACSAPGLPPAGPGPGEVDVGYGTQDEKEVTGAVSTVTDEEIGHVATRDMLELLRARIPGLLVSPRPGGGYRIRIRGTNSMRPDAEPLLVLDGVPMSSSDVNTVLSGFTPDDIRQINVLKDVASTSIYGMRGAGGVILITTRR
jgi:TonB-dependent starch-binding outer membrane protein SusC